MSTLLLLSARDAGGGPSGRVRLLSPEVGTFTCALPPGTVLTPGSRAGFLLALGQSHELLVPEGVEGVVRSLLPERVHAPVGWGDVLYELEPIAAARGRADASPAAAGAGGPLAVRATQSGRFYHRAAPNEPAFVVPGALLAEGQPIGLIEVMKTFTHVPYRREGALPERARAVRYAVADGADVRRGDALLVVEAAEGSGSSESSGSTGTPPAGRGT